MNKNGMGPENLGPLTGRGMGKCNKDFNSDIDNVRFNGRGFGRRKGMGRGNGMLAESALMMRIESLEAEIKALKGNK